MADKEEMQYYVGVVLNESGYINFYPFNKGVFVPLFSKMIKYEWSDVDQPNNDKVFRTMGNIYLYSTDECDIPINWPVRIGFCKLIDNRGDTTHKLNCKDEKFVFQPLHPAIKINGLDSLNLDTKEIGLKKETAGYLKTLYDECGKWDKKIIIYDESNQIYVETELVLKNDSLSLSSAPVAFYKNDINNSLKKSICKLNLEFFDNLLTFGPNKYTDNKLPSEPLHEMEFWFSEGLVETKEIKEAHIVKNDGRLQFVIGKKEDDLEKQKLREDNAKYLDALGLTNGKSFEEFMASLDGALVAAEGLIKDEKDRMLAEVDAAKANAEAAAADAEKKRIAAETAKTEAEEQAKDIIANAEAAKTEVYNALENELGSAGFADVAKIKADEHLANVLMKASANWEKEHEADGISETVQQLNDAGIKQPDDIKQFLFDCIHHIRPHYSKNDVMNLAICMTQGFLTVLSGSPGSGKTSICRSMAALLGLNRQLGNEECRRFVDISVGRGWTSQRDFIGYYNPLSGRFETSNRDMYNALQMLNVEAEPGVGSQYPLYVLLDEANLRPMEHYWSDFIGICDAKKDSDRIIDCGGGKQFRIPETLRFLATINNDDTTTTLSPRLIDRAWVITLPEPTLKEMLASQKDEFSDTDLEGLIRVSWETLQDAFGPDDENKSKLKEELNSENDELSKKYFRVSWKTLQDAFGPDNENKNKLKEELILKLIELAGEGKKLLNGIVSVSPRIFNAMLDYCSAAVSCFVKENGQTTEQAAIDYAIAQKILPQINVMEYSGGSETSGVSARLNAAKEWFLGKSYFHSEEIMRKIIERGKGMDYYRFF